MTDPFFGPGYIDEDEWRDAPLRHRYVHGGFEGTDTRFSFYFPPVENYEGRLLHFFEGSLGGNEKTAYEVMGMRSLELAFACGAYLAESNQGHLGPEIHPRDYSPSVLHWRANAETARYSKKVAAEMYGAPPHHSYGFGGSGGGLRSQHAIERAGDVYDGTVPFMTAHTYLMSDFPVALNALRVLRPKLEAIIDATQVGGSGDPFAGLNSEERLALAELYRSGFPIGATESIEVEGMGHGFLHPQLMHADRRYFEDFWSVPGYLGFDDPAIVASVYEEKASVLRMVTAGELASKEGGVGTVLARMSPPETPVGLVLENGGTKMGEGAIEVLSGKAKGNETCVVPVGDVVVAVTGPGADVSWLKDVAAGDEVLLSNRKYIAQCFWPRYHLSGELRYRPAHQWAVEGHPIYPQGPPHLFMNVGPEYTNQFSGKQIIVQNTRDIACWPAGGAVYHEMVRETFGDRLDDHFRLWWNDNASHMPATFWEFLDPGPRHFSTRLVDYLGSVQQAVFDLIEWVEFGKEPSATTSYDWSDDWQVTLASTAAERGGIQPVVTATANGGIRAEVKVGEPVRFEATAEVPAGMGTVISAEWDFDGTGSWPLKHDEIDGSFSTVRLAATHMFEKPGTYLPAVRITSHRDGDVDARLCRVQNLARVRVVVQ